MAGIKKGTGFYDRSRFLLALAAITVFVPAVAQADDGTDPFQPMDTTVWKSFDRYKEERQQKLFSEMTGNAQVDAKIIAAQDAADEAEAEKKAEEAAIAPPPAPSVPISAPQSAEASALAPPERPLDLPVLPALNTVKFNVPVSLTDKPGKAPVAHVTHIDTQPDLQVPDQNWLDAGKVATNNDLLDDDDKPINVRYATLPSLETPLLGRKMPVSAPKPSRLMQLPQPLPKPPATAASGANAAECAAIDEYRQQQLEALRSDRHTLSALQDAIKELGLNKQLNFMAGGEGKLDIPADAAAQKSAAP